MFRFALRISIPIKTITKSTIIPLRFPYKYSSISQITLEKQQQQDEGPIKKNHSSLTVSYLVNSCGLSLQFALSASKKITIKSAEKPDSVINAFKTFDFTDAQIAKLVNKLPRLLTFTPEKTIVPKLEFLRGAGFSSAQLIDIICASPVILTNSLEKRLKPNFHLLTSLFETNQQIAIALCRTSWLLCANLETRFLPNIRILRGCGVPASNITKFANLNPRNLCRATERFKESADLISEMGFNPCSAMFIHGILAMLGNSTSTWKRKAALFRKLGWSEEEVISAFTKQPSCMLTSEEKIVRSMEFFVKKMHWEPSFVAAHPVLLKLSLEKRVIPRCSVLNVLTSKGLVMKRPSMVFLNMSEENFFSKYVIKYQDLVPEVLQAYNGNLDFVGPEGNQHIQDS